ncbi:amidohydrolase [Marinobacter sp. BGYM27]|uniref:amidohydrolase n=1 Tax=Marinobacter sp. BGYM27 TaxID=2975597 RepID=UPI0021A5AD91|nr:amidohydrolase [Marinobacter sp. BGYM27]MDG5498138.1 amidohydrolase [Marinobacter sp. BGYM27]
MPNLNSLQSFRQTLHRHPDLSGHEEATAARIREKLAEYQPDQIVDNIGGAGLLAVYDSQKPGPTTLIRCELDALPIHERSAQPYCSAHHGRAHACGHDGHMAIVMAVAQTLSRSRPASGRVILLFQPAEEDGQGARRVFADPAFTPFRPDYAFALHNVPGLPLGEVFTRPGPFNCASRGLIIHLEGKTSHAAHPEEGISPTGALARLMEQLPQLPGHFNEATWVTLVHAKLGEKAFGTAPGDAVLMATLRTETNDAMTLLADQACAMATAEAKAAGLSVRFEWEDDFLASVNTAQGYQHIVTACEEACVPCHTMDEGFRWSEDFGVFTLNGEGAMFGLGAGIEHPQLHNPDYDFPDELIPVGQSVFLNAIRRLNGMG